jgi:DNA-binding SARP family transcriptional activator
LTARTRGRELQFQLLGQLGVTAGAGIVDLGAPKQRAVLAVLLLHANEIVSTDRIIDLVWGGKAPRTAEHSIQIYISELRKTLSNGSSNDLIETRPPGYVINIPPDSVDTLRFERLVREGISAVRSGDLPRGRPKLIEALELWTGDPLAEFAYEDFAQSFIRSLTELHSDALEAMAAVELEQGRPAEARDLAAAAIEADPLREEPRRIMMMALYRSGRQTEALRHFSAYRALLTEELGIEPSPAMSGLEERILLQDPDLELHPIATSEGNPYRGLRSFTENDADIYFGREALVEETLERLRRGPGFVSLVGPSGSGKSSAAQAGVVPTLRERGESVAVIQPGSRPLWELAGAMDHAGFGARAALLRRLERDPATLVELITRPMVIVVDQLEELFTLAEPDAAVRFGELVSAAVVDPGTPLKVVATLRADYYDKPLSLPRLAGVFSDSVVTVKPMTAQEVERAVVEPARKAGVAVEPALLAQLVADMGDEPGALPLLQFALFQLFERTSNRLSLADYERIGGIHGALTAGADELIEALGPDERDLVEQLMMRMVQKGRAVNTSRPVLLRDLVELGSDTVALHAVLETFGARRLVTFDRDASGAAVVEMAHEFLITGWPQMERWLDLHSEDLDRLFELSSASTEWLAADRSADYLLRGVRLEDLESWAAGTSLRLTRIEAEFLDASSALRERNEASRREQAEKEASLRRGGGSGRLARQLRRSRLQ